jgi:sodium-dependent phosphate cotransporter
MSAGLKAEDAKSTLQQRIIQVMMLLAVVYLFLVSLELMGASFKLFGKDFAKNLVTTASNPVIGLFIGMLATAIVQSSSTTTSTVVVLVASGAFGPAGDPATIGLAIPIIMGANIGTSVTSTIVALGHIGNRSEYRKAIAAATLHDFFNLITVVILFPLEMMFGILSKPAAYLAESLYVGGGDGGVLGALKVVKHATQPLAELAIDGAGALIGAGAAAVPVMTLLAALVLLFFSLRGLTAGLKKLLIGRLQEKVDTVLFGHPLKAIAWGAAITTFVQSSSVTSSLTVPLVATDKVSLRKAFPFLMGANIGTTTTALIAALLATGENPIAGLAIALCHVLFNLIGVVLIYPIPQIRKIPLYLAERVGEATTKNRLVGIGYIVGTFFLLPFVLIMATSGPAHLPKDVSQIRQEIPPANVEVVKREVDEVQ